MSGRWEDSLPDWSAGAEAGSAAYDGLPVLAAHFVRLTQRERQAGITDYVRRHFVPRMDLPRASGLYLFLRLEPLRVDAMQ